MLVKFLKYKDKEKCLFIGEKKFVRFGFWFFFIVYK